MASVEISELRKLYGDVVALENINISVESGAFFTLLGPSGCGKTTLLRTIAGFHTQNSGTIQIDGKSIEAAPAHKRDVGMVFQDYAVFPHLSVYENVAFGLKQRKLPKAEIARRVAETLRVVQLDPLAERMPHELSGGQQQRVGLARAIVINPTVLLMDEPLSNLDAKLRVDLRAELRRIQKSMGMTTIYVTHDQEEALAMSDVVCVMFNGVVQQAASPVEIYRRPANKFVANFVGGNNFLRTTFKKGELSLAAGGKSVGSTSEGENVVAAIRPEEVSVHVDKPDQKPGTIMVPVTIEQISFIGREMEIHGRTETDEVIKAVSRPDEAVLNQKEGGKLTFAFPQKEVMLFIDKETGRRLS